MLAQAMQICTAVDAEPACISKEIASYNATAELTRHRFFLPERADMGAGRIMGREKMAKVWPRTHACMHRCGSARMHVCIGVAPHACMYA